MMIPVNDGAVTRLYDPSARVVDIPAHGKRLVYRVKPKPKSRVSRNDPPAVGSHWHTKDGQRGMVNAICSGMGTMQGQMFVIWEQHAMTIDSFREEMRPVA